MNNLLKIAAILFCSASMVFAQHENHQAAPKPVENQPKPKSPHTSAMEMVGKNHVHIDYSSPSVRGRNIWNGLVAYNQVWSAGAHNATWIDFSENVKINNQTIPKGKYGFFLIPSEKEWTIILNKNWNMHLADDYKQDLDILRIKVLPIKNAELVEALKYEVLAENDKKGKIKFTWEYLSLSLDFVNK